jgi:lysophospholipase L1-like esterase
MYSKNHYFISLALSLFCSLLSTNATASDHYDSLSDKNVNKSELLADKTVLIIGDSQTVGSFGHQLGKLLISDYEAKAYYRFGKSGWGVNNWLSKKYFIKSILNRYEPDVVLIELGGNDSSIGHTSSYQKSVQLFWDLVHVHTKKSAHILWISPANTVGKSSHLQPYRDITSETIKQIVGEENYIESRNITGDYGRTPDGLHFNLLGGKSWAQSVITKLIHIINKRQNKDELYKDINIVRSDIIDFTDCFSTTEHISAI